MVFSTKSFHRLFEVVDCLVDERVGIIRHVFEARRDARAPKLFCFYAVASDTKALGFQKNYADAAGASADRAEAMAKAIGEAVERYCAAIYDGEELPFSSYNSAVFPCIAPEQFALYSQKQYADGCFPYRPFTRDTAIRWRSSIDLLTGGTWYVPAAMVYVPYIYQEGETPIVQPISTGLACHGSEAEASISGMCEVIERDAFTITWQAKLSPPQLMLESLSERNRDLIERFQATGALVKTLNITLDHGVPTILSALRYITPDAPALILSAAAHPDPETAVRKSLEELELCRRLAQILKSQNQPIDPGPNYENIVNQHSHLRFFSEQMNSHLADFLFDSKEWLNFGDLPSLSRGRADLDLDALVNNITDSGHQILLADLTTPDIRQLGLSVVRIIIPGFHPLFFGHRLRALGGSRLWHVPQKLGHTGATSFLGDNSVPHPFP
jgi:ribosomal protein S12 methylthiotransferase accessory factor